MTHGSDWYERNAPLVQAYLATLPPRAIGTALAGIPVSDGGRWFEGDVYLGRREDLQPGLTVVLLEKEGQRVAYLWINEGGAPFPLEACPVNGPDAGIRAWKLGGAPYAWRALEPAHGIVYTYCPPDAWMP